MSDKKFFLKTRRFWGAAVMMAGLFVDMPPEVEAGLPDLAPELVDNIDSLIGMLVAWWGYAKRDPEKKVTVKPDLPWLKK